MAALTGFTVLAVMSLYVLCFVAVGVRGIRFKGFPLFATARGTLKPYTVGLSTAATLASANLFIGVPGWAYTYGYPVFWWIFGNVVMMSIGLFLLAPRFFAYSREHNAIYTLPQWLGSFYKNRWLARSIAILTLFNIYYIVGQNIGLATILEVITASTIPYQWGVIIAVLIVVIYVGFGGQHASIVTDSIQCVAMALTGLLIFGSLFTIFGAGALGEIHAGLLAQDQWLVSLRAKTGIFSGWLSIISIQWLLLTFVLLPHLANRVLALEKKEDLKPFLITAATGFFFVSSFMVFAGLATRVLYPGLEVADSAVPTFVTNTFSPVIAGIVMGGILAAVLSTADSLYVGISTVVANDLIATRRKITASRCVIIATGAVSWFLSMNRPESLTLLTQFGIATIISGVVAPLVFALFLRPRIDGWYAYAAFLGGSGTYFALSTFGVTENVFQALLFASIVSFLIMGVAYLYTQKRYMGAHSVIASARGTSEASLENLPIANIENLHCGIRFAKVGMGAEVFSPELLNHQVAVHKIKLDPGTAFDPHYHQSHHILYVLEGSGCITTWDITSSSFKKVVIAEESKKEYRLTKGDIIQISKELVHSMSASTEEAIIVLAFGTPYRALSDPRRLVFV